MRRTDVRRRRLRIAGLAIGGLILTIGAYAPQSSLVDARQLGQQAQEQRRADLDWRHHGNDLGNARYQNVDSINRTNVGGLVPLWIFHTGLLDERSSFEVSPIVVGNVMYISTGHDDVYALDATTGKEIWSYHPLAQMPPLDELSICCGRDSRGVAYGDGLIFIGRLDAVLVALDAKSGKVVWETKVEDWQQDYTITMAPQFVRGKVITGVSGGEFEVRGTVSAFDAKTGRRAWKFFTTQPTFQNERTWAGASWRHGGAPVWTTPAVDPDLGLIYIATGNASPDLNGINREGNNLFTASIVALDIETGKYRWHFQEIHHDIWDYDGPQPPVLFTLERGSQGVPALSHCNKSGEHFILDRRTGEPLHPVSERAVPEGPEFQHASPTQPVSSVEALTPLEVEVVPPGNKAAERFTPPQPTPLLMQPGTDGGCEWPPAAYSPRTKFVYYGTRYEPMVFEAVPEDTTGFGSSIVPVVPGVDARGIFGAVDTVTGRIAWKVDIPDQPARSGVVVAGDLVFFGQNDGTFNAYDAETGVVLWSFDGTSVQNGGGANAAPIAYVVDGKEFIANAFGGNRLERARRVSPLGDALIVFGLPGDGYSGPNVVHAAQGR